MPNQREIAKALGVSVATVSMALRGDRTISTKMRERVCKTAERMGYRPNAYVNVLMAQVRSGRKISDQGVIALLIDARSEQEWHQKSHVFRIYQQGVMRRCVELGFHLETFFLQEPGMRADKIDSILHARGIRGLILAPRYKGDRVLPMQWEWYACVAGAHAWVRHDFDLVASDHAYNVRLAFEELTRLGYERIGMSLELRFVENRGVPKWLPGFLEAQHYLPEKNRVPLFTGNYWNDDQAAFEGWLSKWKPDVVLTMRGFEKGWLDKMGVRVPEDIGLASCVLRSGDLFSGIDENFGHVGAIAVEQVTAKIARNEYGPSEHPKQILIPGRWVEGATTRNQP